MRRDNAQLLPLTEDAAQSLASFPYYEATDVQFDNRAIRTLEIKAVLASGTNLTGFGWPDKIKTITDSLAENLIHIQRAHPRFRTIRAASITSNVPIALHEGAKRAYCDRGLLSCAAGWTWLAVATLILAAYLSVMSVRARTALVQFAPRVTSFLVGPFGTTRAYRYILIPATQIFFLVLGVVAIRELEAGYAQASNVPNPFSHMSVWDNLGWGFTVATTGHNGDLFPTGQFAIFIAASLQVIGRGGVLLLIGAYASDRLARILKMGRDLKTLRDHTIICHWNDEAAGVIRDLTNPELKGRRQVVVVLADRESDPTERLSDVSNEHVSFIRGQPSNTADLMKAGLAKAYQVMILADAKFPDPDARTVLAVLAIESLSQRFQETKERTTNIRTMAQLVDPANRPALVTANVDEIICGARFEERLLVQSTLNPGLSRFLDEILEVGDYNEIYEVPVREEPSARTGKGVQIVGRTFDEVLVDCRKSGVLLLAIDPGGAPNVVAASQDGESAPRRRRTSASMRPVSIDGLELPTSQTAGRGSRKLRPMLTNPYRPKEVSRRIKVGDSLLFLAESEKPLEQIFGSSKDWLTAFKEG
ncbi:MAG: NAD-binding protein [Gemmatimonadetes bacterium]|nr:NAD-binding protein [Gemmatimonadota bacterium]